MEKGKVVYMLGMSIGTIALTILMLGSFLSFLLLLFTSEQAAIILFWIVMKIFIVGIIICFIILWSSEDSRDYIERKELRAKAIKNVKNHKNEVDVEYERLLKEQK